MSAPSKQFENFGDRDFFGGHAFSGLAVAGFPPPGLAAAGFPPPGFPPHRTAPLAVGARQQPSPDWSDPRRALRRHEGDPSYFSGGHPLPEAPRPESDVPSALSWLFQEVAALRREVSLGRAAPPPLPPPAAVERLPREAFAAGGPPAGLGPDPLPEAVCGLYVACESGQLSEARRVWPPPWLAFETEATLASILSAALAAAARRGHVEVAAWLVAGAGNTFGEGGPHGPPSELGRPGRLGRLDLVAAFDEACSNGHIAAAKFLYGLGLTLDDLRGTGCGSFRGACMRGHLVLAKWLHGCGLTTEDLSAGGHMAFLWARAYGRSDITRWLESLGAAPEAWLAPRAPEGR